MPKNKLTVPKAKEDDSEKSFTEKRVVLTTFEAENPEILSED